MIVNLTRKKFLEMVQKIELINWFEINYAVQKKPSRPPPPKNIQLWQYLAMKLSFHIWVSTSLFQTYFGRSFSGISPPKVLGVGTFSKEKGFSWGTNFWRSNLLGDCSSWRRLRGTNDQIMPRGDKFHKMHFTVIWPL